MLQIVIVHALVAIAAPWIMAKAGRKGFLLLALAPLSAFVYAVAMTPAVLAGDLPHQSIEWISWYQMDLVLRMDTLSWLMALIVGGVGALVLGYCASYFSAKAGSLGRFGGSFVAFAGAMLGLVTADSTLLMFIFWELTSVFSFLLIGHYHERQGSRRAALQAVMVTTTGGLAMLGGICVLGVMPGGSFSFTELVAAAQDGRLGSGPADPLLTVGIVLVLLGAFTKSAMVPFHFWLPNAMAAPTPVSAYLHSSAMVKAGVYLVARMAPGFSETAVWTPVVLTVALTTMLVGGYRSLRQHDLKLVLAFGTISQLGLITAMVGHGDRAVALAGLALLAGHSLFKATLFLTVGIVDWAAGTRDLRELSGLGRREPLLAGIGAVAGLSMMGFPPMSGYVAKEAALHALWYEVEAGGAWDTAVYAAVALGSVLTAAYTLRFWWGAFCSKPGVETTEARSCRNPIVLPPLVTAVAVLALGLMPGPWETAVAPYADTYLGEAGHLALWGGFGVPLWTTVGIIALGVLLFVLRAPVEAAQAAVPVPGSAEGAYRRIIRGLDNVSADITAWVQRGSLPGYLSVILTTMLALMAGAALLGSPVVGPVKFWDSAGQAGVALVMVVASLLVVRARRRLKAVILMGVVGYGMVVIYELHGAADLALTQVLAESVTLVVFILVLRRLPAYFSNRPLPATRFLRAVLAGAVGVVVAGVAMLAAWSRVHTPVSVDFAEGAYNYGYGKNIVNVTLVDIRAWDTMGEIAVVVAAATGVASLIFLRRRHGKLERVGASLESPHDGVWGRGQAVPEAYQRLRRPGEQNRDWLRVDARNRRLLSGSGTLAPHRRSVIFEIGVRIIFHTLAIFSIYLLFAGHNYPGGGFAAGLVAGVALGVRYLAGGRFELAEALPIKPGHLLGAGLLTAMATALAPVPFGGTILQSYDAYLHLGPLGEIHLVSAMAFDVGVFLVVVGLMLDLLQGLGAELDRQMEVAGQRAPDVSHDAEGQTADEVMPGTDRRNIAMFDPIYDTGQLSKVSITREEFEQRRRQIRRHHARGVWEEER